jgi:hypothetical protein
MLTGNSIEAQTGVVEMVDASYEAVQAFVEFMYLERTDKFEELITELFILADKYEVPSLKYKCVKHLNDAITNENVLERLSFGFYFMDAELKKAALQHIINIENAMNYRVLFSSQGWNELCVKSRELAQEISTAIFNKLKV